MGISMMGTPEKNRTMQFDYYYGSEADQFTFIKVPKALIANRKRFRISSDAILLYGMLLDRMQLSIRNRWIDMGNRVYIIYRITEIMEDFDCSNKTAGQILNELNDFGLIEKVRRGQGKPDLIYVKNFIQREDLSYLASEGEEDTLAGDATDAAQSQEITGVFQKCKNYISGDVDSTLQERKNLHFKECKNYTQNKTDINNTNINNTDSIYPSIYLSDCMPVQEVAPAVSEDGGKGKTRTEAQEQSVDTDKQRIRENLNYDFYMRHGDEGTKRLMQECYRLICDAVCVPRKAVNIGGVQYPYAFVRERLLQLTDRHLEYVMECMEGITASIGNMRAYLLTALYNAPATMSHYYAREAREDLYG